MADKQKEKSKGNASNPSEEIDLNALGDGFSPVNGTETVSISDDDIEKAELKSRPGFKYNYSLYRTKILLIYLGMGTILVIPLGYLTHYIENISKNSALPWIIGLGILEIGSIFLLHKVYTRLHAVEELKSDQEHQIWQQKEILAVTRNPDKIRYAQINIKKFEGQLKTIQSKYKKSLIRCALALIFFTANSTNILFVAMNLKF